MIERYLKAPIAEHIKKFRQMIFLTGPRQVGKTTLAKSLLGSVVDGVNYLNWDLAAHRRLLTTGIFQGKVDLGEPGRKLMVFDEIHKYPRWKNALKGLFDRYEPHTRWVITGSAALNIFRKGQDSLIGRSFVYHLFPLSVAEAAGLGNPIMPEGFAASDLAGNEVPDAVLTRLLEFGGFPEPFLKEDGAFLKRWRSSRLERLVNQDLASTEHIRNLPILEHLMFMLPSRTGNPLSINGLRENLEVHHATVSHWIDLLERIFYGFRLRPFSGKIERALKKEAKWYLWDWTEVEDPGIRFENLVAVHLLKYVQYINDLGLGKIDIFYLRDKQKREVDFMLTTGGKPLMLIECKLNEESPAESLVYYAKRLGVPRAVQLLRADIAPQSKTVNGAKISILPAGRFLSNLV
jgi:predicted AAA+ superfamily ATPase